MKVLDSIGNKTHDFLEDEIVVPVQHMFPNCRKYRKCCREDKGFWEKVQKEKHTGYSPDNYTKIIKFKITKAPEGFEGW